MYLLIILTIALSLSFIPTPVFPSPAPTVFPSPTLIPSATPVPSVAKISLQTVPFTSQAPNADWQDPRLQDACEEAAVLMAYHWAVSLPLDAKKSLTEIYDLVSYQEVNFQEYRDTSLSDSATRLLAGFYSYQDYQIHNGITKSDIKNAIVKGNLVIVPVDGQLLKNPHYSGLGPERHMLLVIGYDSISDEFVTNDAGTKSGKGYRYDSEVLYQAIRDYHSGYHVPIKSVKKNMLEIYKSL